MTEVTILGAGVAGLCVAHELTTRGASVRLIDPQGGLTGCSRYAGGMLAPFCEGETAVAEIVTLGRAAADWWAAAGVQVERRGTLVVALGRDQRELVRFGRRVPQHRALSAPEISELEPALAERFQKALFVQDEAHLDPRKALSVLRDGLARQGVSIVADGPISGQLIDCRGLAARDELPKLRGVRGEMVILRAPDVTLHRPIRMLHPRHPIYIVPRGEGLYMLGATQIESGDQGPARLRGIAELLNAAYALHPAFAEAEVLEIGADARPAFPDNMPRVVQAPDRIHVNGLFRHGFLMAPALAQEAATLVLNSIKPEHIE